MEENYTTSWVGSTKPDELSGVMKIYNVNKVVVHEIELESFADYRILENILTESKRHAFRAGFKSFKNKMIFDIESVSIPPSIWG